MTLPSAAAAADPFLVRFATPRTAQPPMPGRYSSALGVWVVDGAGGEQPIVETADGSLVSTQSKTMTQVEVDDDDPTRFGSMETGTYTKCSSSDHLGHLAA